MIKRFGFLDLSGYMFSGKAAVHDLIAEIDGFSTPGNRIEFDLLRVKDGIADLESALISWSPVRADSAARRFLNVVKKIGDGSTRLSRLTTPGFGYADRYPKLVQHSREFIDAITVAAWDMYWPYHLLDMSRLEILRFKIGRKLFGRHENVHYRLISRELFYEAVKIYLHDLLSEGIDRDSFHTIVLNNAFEPFDPTRYIAYFEDAKSIIVERDPRDIFVVANLPSEGFNDQVELYRRIAGAFDVQIFIQRFKTYRAHTSSIASDRILRLKFEDLVLDYERTVTTIYQFLGITANAHCRKKMYFDPAISSTNVGMWRDYPDQRSIRMIEEAYLA